MTDDEFYIQFINDIIDGEIDLNDEYYDDYEYTRRTNYRKSKRIL